jgi:hypothetical protein
MRLVYVAGPLTLGLAWRNVADACRAATQLTMQGFVPFVPHLCTLWDQIAPIGERTAMRYDLVWLSKCDAMLRLPGRSRGADTEEAFAKLRSIPVFYDVETLLDSGLPLYDENHFSNRLCVEVDAFLDKHGH